MTKKLEEVACACHCGQYRHALGGVTAPRLAQNQPLRAAFGIQRRRLGLCLEAQSLAQPPHPLLVDAVVRSIGMGLIHHSRKLVVEVGLNRYGSVPGLCEVFWGHACLNAIPVPSFTAARHRPIWQRTALKARSPRYLCRPCSLRNFLERTASWRGVRVVDRARLESVCTERYRGFESRSLRKNDAKPTI